MSTSFIGEAILFNIGNGSECLVFLGADQMGNGRWRVNLSREYTTLYYSHVVQLHIDVSEGQIVRMPHFAIRWDQERNMPSINRGGLIAVSAIRFVSLACDCIELEYLFQRPQ